MLRVTEERKIPAVKPGVAFDDDADAVRVGRVDGLLQQPGYEGR